MQLIILQVIDRFRDTRGCKPTLSFTYSERNLVNTCTFENASMSWSLE